MSASKWNAVPYKFEAGTPSIAEAVGLGAAAEYLSALGMDWINAHERALVGYAYERLGQVEGLRILGPGPDQRSGLISFTVDEIHPHDLSAILDQTGVAVRAGHHCAQPIHDRFGIPASARASLYFYNTTEDIDQLVSGLERAVQIFAW